jgi:hypothetical protein
MPPPTPNPHNARMALHYWPEIMQMCRQEQKKLVAMIILSNGASAAYVAEVCTMTPKQVDEIIRVFFPTHDHN